MFERSKNVMSSSEFEYFLSPEAGNDEEIIANCFLYCTVAVDQWPQFRRDIEVTGELSRQQCDLIERNAIEVFKEVRDAIFNAIESDDLKQMSSLCLLDRFAHAHCSLALFADSASLLAYRRMICPQIDSLPPSRRPQTGDFSQAIWKGKWNEMTDRRPTEVTFQQTLHFWRQHEKDGLFNTNARLDPVAKASLFLDAFYPAPEPVTALSTMQLAFLREKLRSLGREAGLPKGHADFLVRIALDGAKQQDNPAAWRAIRDRKREPLLAKVREMISSLRDSPENIS
jgi:hypothetical protein